MRKSLVSLVVSFILTAIFSCQKSTSAVVLTKTDFLVESPWKITKFEQKAHANDPYVDQFSNLQACTRDDLYTFARSNTYQLTEGPTKCNAIDPDLIFTGFWLFQQNETILQMDNMSYNLLRLNDTLIISNATFLAPDSTYNRITLAH